MRLDQDTYNGKEDTQVDGYAFLDGRALAEAQRAKSHAIGASQNKEENSESASRL